MSEREPLNAMRRAVWLAMLAGAVSGVSCQEFTLPIEIEGAAEPAAPIQLTGAGATFPAPLYEEWFRRFNSRIPTIQVSYEAVGSAEGVQRFLAGEVDFGASDRALTDEEIVKVRGGILHVPMTAGAIGLVYNLPEVAPLQLSREAYAGIFLGKVTRWNDPILVKCNPYCELPDREIRLVVRAESSGSTYVLTNHLSTVSPEWAA